MIGTSTPVSKIFELTIAIAKTKHELVIVNCISPMIAAERRQELHKAIFFPLLFTLLSEKGRDAGEQGTSLGNFPTAFL